MLSAEGFDLLLLDMSEFRKMDGGLSCLSLRFLASNLQINLHFFAIFAGNYFLLRFSLLG